MRILPSIALAAIVVSLVSGCVPSQPLAYTPAPQPTSTPVFASEEEALAAAVEAYAGYQREVDAALTTYDVSNLDTVADGEALSAALESVKSFEQSGRRQVGESVTRGESLAQADLLTAELVQIYACLDISATDVLDASGSSTVTGSRPETLSVIVSLEWRAGNDVLVVSSEEVWDGDFCG